VHCKLALSSAGKARGQFPSGSDVQLNASLSDRFGDQIDETERVILVSSRDEKEVVDKTGARVLLEAVESG
jgi:hypothetical protein